MLMQFLTNDFMPHGHCYYWQPGLLWTHVGADGLIAAAYFSIPLSLLYYLRQRPEVRYRWVVWLFAAFIVLCGITHLFGIVTIWNPVYPLEALIKVLCAAVSLATAIVLIPLVPRALTMRTAEELEAINARLYEVGKSRRRAEGRLSAKVRELEQSNQELEQFAYVASHDLQTPIRSIVSFDGLLRRELGDGASERAKEYLDIIEHNGRHMQQLILDLLDYSRVRTRARPLERASVARACQSACDLLRQEIEANDAHVEMGELPEVMGDESQLTQVFQNLIANAVKFQPPGQSAHIAVGAKDEGDYVRIRVEDNGIGINPDHADDVFTIFRRLHTDDEYQGTGIGLAICKRIVERHGGEIRVVDNPGGGARFEFTLPKPESHELAEGAGQLSPSSA